MARGERSGTVSVVVPAPVEQVREHLLDLRNLVGLHPLILAVDPLPAPYVPGRRAFRVTDSIAVGGLRLRTGYHAEIGPVDGGDLVAEARSVPAVRVHTRYRFTPTADGTEIVEQLRIEAPRLLAGWVWQTAHRAHRTMLDALRERFAERNPS